MPAQAWSMAMASVFVMMSHTRDIRSSLDMLKPSTSGLDTMHHSPKWLRSSSKQRWFLPGPLARAGERERERSVKERGGAWKHGTETDRHHSLGSFQALPSAQLFVNSRRVNSGVRMCVRV